MDTEPSVAERSRTALAEATVGTLVTGRCAPARALTLVGVVDQPDGRPLVRLDVASPTVQALARWPVATLAVPVPAPFRALDLTGSMQPCRSDRPGLRCYRLSLLSARIVGARSVVVPLGAYGAARPDPLRDWAPAALHHMGTAHAPELLACVRAHGQHEAQAAVPRALDRYGIELVALGPDGVDLLRLPFPDGPVDDLDQVAAGLRPLLTCRCGHGHERAS